MFQTIFASNSRVVNNYKITKFFLFPSEPTNSNFPQKTSSRCREKQEKQICKTNKHKIMRTTQNDINCILILQSFFDGWVFYNFKLFSTSSTITSKTPTESLFCVLLPTKPLKVGEEKSLKGDTIHTILTRPLYFSPRKQQCYRSEPVYS